MLAIFKREMRSYFTSPVGYMFCAIFFAVSGFLFMLNTVQAGEDSNYAGYFSIILFLFIVIIPLLTMKLVSEERKMRTDQLIMTAPITLADIVFGKYFAALAMFGGCFIISSIIYYIPLAMYGKPNLAGDKPIDTAAHMYPCPLAALPASANSCHRSGWV